MSGDAFFAGAKQVSRQQPFMQRNMRALVNCADRCREWLLALAAFIDTRARALALQFGCAINAAAMRTNRAIRPTQFLEMRSGGFFVVKGRVGNIYGHRASLSCYLGKLCKRQRPVNVVSCVRGQIGAYRLGDEAADIGDGGV